MRKNHDLVDLSKFLFSLMVLGIHSLILGNNTLGMTFLRIAVPVFFLFSSYFFFYRIEELDNKAKYKHLVKTIKRNMKLYLFWFMLLLPITLYARDLLNSSILAIAKELLWRFFFGATFLASWYITSFVIALCIVYYLFERKKEYSKIAVWTVMLITYSWCLVTSNYSFILSKFGLETIFEVYQKLFGFPSNSFVVAVFWVSLGFLLYKEDLFNKSKTDYVVLLISIMLLVIEFTQVRGFFNERFSSDVYVFLIPVAVSLSKIIINSAVRIPYAKTFRELSTVIYCTHFSIFLVIKTLLLRLLNWDNTVVSYLLTVVACCGVYCLIKCLEKIKGLQFLKCAY